MWRTDRRRLVDAIGGLAGGLTGCLGNQPPPRPAAGGGVPFENVTGEVGSPADICSRDPRPGRVPAIVEPAFAPDWSGVAGGRLTDDTTVVGLERAGEARAYPLSVLPFEIVNDRFEAPVLVTYCPLCASGLTAIRKVDDEAAVFGNTSYTW